MNGVGKRTRENSKDVWSGDVRLVLSVSCYNPGCAGSGLDPVAPGLGPGLEKERTPNLPDPYSFHLEKACLIGQPAAAKCAVY